MRAPPAASWPVADDRRWRAVHALLFAAAAASAVVWLARLAEAAGPAAVAAASAAALAGAAAGWWLGRQPQGRIDWTGSQWRWSVRDGPGQVVSAPEVMLDLQGWMLLRWRPQAGGRRCWCSVARGGPPGDAGGTDAALRWTAFRAAVYSAASRHDTRSGPERPLP